MLETLRRYKKTALTLGMFAVYTVGLLWSYYDAQGKLQEDVLNEVRLEAEKQAAAISYFFSERRNDLADLAASPEVGNFFVNRDMGMSYEYGLGINVGAIEAKFGRLLAQKQLGAAPIYLDFALVDENEQVIARARRDGAEPIDGADVRAVAGRDVAVRLDTERNRLYFAAPVQAKARYRGKVLAWADGDVISGLITENRQSRLATRVVTAGAAPGLRDGITADLSPSLRRSLDELFARGRPAGAVPAANGDTIAVVRVGIAGTPFSLLAPVSREYAGTRSMPLPFLVAAALVPLAVLAIAVLDAIDRKRGEELREAARAEAERLADLRSEFLANMSHEIRTPLNGVLGLAQIGYRNNVGRPEVLDTFARILHSGRLLLSIVNDVLDFSKIEAGKLALEKAPVDIARLIDEVSQMLSERAAEKNIDLHVEKSADLPEACLSDPTRLAQILTNLLANAVKFTETGQVTLRASHNDGWLHFSITDTGVGMTEEQLARLFAPFEQADSSTTRRFGGTGLGLAITKRLVDLMAGTIRVDSRLGRGTAFHVSIPYVPVPAGESVAHALPAPITDGPRLSGVRILVAEDNDVNRLILEDMLSAEGALVVMVENGRQAVDRVRRDGGQAYDLVLMDVQMPEMDGYQATREILRIAPDLPVVAQTAHAFAEEMDRCRAAGMIDQVTKPIDAEKLVAMVSRHARSAPAPAVAPPAAAPPAPAPGPRIDAAGARMVDWAALHSRYGRNPAFLEKLLGTATATLATSSENLRSALRDGDTDRAIFLAHSLKGAAGSLMAAELARMASEAELACRGHAAEAGDYAASLADAAEAVVREIRQRPAA